MIDIRLNGETREIPDETDVSRLLVLLALPSQRIAIELNDKVIRRKDWTETLLCNGDKVEVVHFVGGG